MELNIDDRPEQIHKNEGFITIKDRKNNFSNIITCRLINQSKSDIGKINKNILNRINKNKQEIALFHQH